MRELTPEERELLRRREALAEQVISERMPVLAEFAAALGLADPPLIVNDPESYLPYINAFMRNQIVEEHDRAWATTRVAYLIGEVLVQRLGGRWFLNPIPDSRYFARVVVGDCTRLSNRNVMVDPFEIAVEFLSLPRGRDLAKTLNEVEQEFREA